MTLFTRSSRPRVIGCWPFGKESWNGQPANDSFEIQMCQANGFNGKCLGDNRTAAKKVPKNEKLTKKQKGKKHPDITFGSPLPSPEIVDKCLGQILDEFNFGEIQKAALIKLEPKHKWHIYCTKRQEISNTDNLANTYISSLKQLQDKLYISHHANDLNFRSMLDEPDLNLCQNLGIDLRCKSIKLVRTFLELSGLETIFHLLQLIAIDLIRHLNANCRLPISNGVTKEFQLISTNNYPHLGLEMLKHLITCVENLVMTSEGIGELTKNDDGLQLLIGFLNDAFFYVSVKKEVCKSEGPTKVNHIATSTPTLNGRHRITDISAQDQSPTGGTGRKKCRAPKLPQTFLPFPTNITVKSKICNILRLLVLTLGTEAHARIMKLFTQISKTLGYKSRFQKLLWDLRDSIRVSQCHMVIPSTAYINLNMGEKFGSPFSLNKRHKIAPRILVNDHSTRGDMSDYTTHSLTHNYTPLSPLSLNYHHGDHHQNGRHFYGNLCSITHTPTAHRDRSSTHGSSSGNHYDSITPKKQHMDRAPYDNMATESTPKHTLSLSSIFTFSPRAPQISLLSKGSTIKTTAKSTIKMGVKIYTEFKPRPQAKKEMTSSRVGSGHKRARSLPSVNGDVTVYDNATYVHDDNRPLPRTTQTPMQYNKASLVISRYTSAILSLVNTLISYGPGKESLEYRIHLRYEFLMLDIEENFRLLRLMGADDAIENHMKLFEFIRRKDEDILNADFQTVSVDLSDIGGLFQILLSRLGASPGYNSMASFLYHILLLMRNKTQISDQLWIFLDALVQQITINSEKDLFPHVNLHAQISQFLNRSSTLEADYTDIKNRVTLLLSDLAISQSYLAKMENQLKESEHHKEQLAQTLTKINQEYEKEVNKRQQAENAVRLLNEKINEIISTQDLAFKNKNVPDEVAMPLKRLKVVMSITTNNDDNDVISDSNNATSLLKPNPSAGIPPPPPPLPGLIDAIKLKRKNIPKPSQALKSLNWTIIPESKLKNTIWAEMDETWLYKEMDLNEFEQLFSAYHKPQQHTSSGECTDGGQNSPLFGSHPGNSSPKLGFGHANAMSLSLIEGRRAQNCTILLSKLKISNSDIVETILTLDPDNILHKDMCEQLLKFVPTPDEINLLNEHGSECDSFAKADRFLFDMSKVFRYEHKLQGLNFQKRFREKVTEVKTKIAAIAKASDDVLNELTQPNSKENSNGGILRKILETTLALGNYMNRGSRSNAFAFSLESLNRLAETRSTANSNFNLLHYLIGFLEASVAKSKAVEGDIEGNLTLHSTSFMLEKRLESIKLASKINLGDLDSEMWALTRGLNDLENEVEIHYEASSHVESNLDPRDGFINGMTVFLDVSKLNFNQLQQSHKLMKLKYEKLTQLLGENIKQEDVGRNDSNDVCHNIFMKLDNFLISYKDATTEYYKFLKVDKNPETPVKMHQHKNLLQDSPHQSFNESKNLPSQKEIFQSGRVGGANNIKKKPSYCRRSSKQDNEGLLDCETTRYGRHGSNVSDWQVKELIEVLQNG